MRALLDFLHDPKGSVLYGFLSATVSAIDSLIQSLLRNSKILEGCFFFFLFFCFFFYKVLWVEDLVRSFAERKEELSPGRFLCSWLRIFFGLVFFLIGESVREEQLCVGWGRSCVL